jgi:hypothetical protein
LVDRCKRCGGTKRIYDLIETRGDEKHISGGLKQIRATLTKKKMKKRKKKCLISVRLPVYKNSNQPFVLTPKIILIPLRKKASANEQELLSKFMKFQYEYSALEPPVVNYRERYVDIRRTSHDSILFPT